MCVYYFIMCLTGHSRGHKWPLVPLFSWPAGPCLSCQMSTAGAMSELFGWGHIQYILFGYTGSSVFLLFISSDLCWPGWSTRSACSSVELRGFHSGTRSCGWLGEWPVDMVRACRLALKLLNFLRRESHCLFPPSIAVFKADSPRWVTQSSSYNLSLK